MHELPDTESDALDALLRSDPELRRQLDPLLDGRYGLEARRLVLASLAERLSQGSSPGAALIPALADAMHEARGDRGE